MSCARAREQSSKERENAQEGLLAENFVVTKPRKEEADELEAAAGGGNRPYIALCTVSVKRVVGRPMCFSREGRVRSDINICPATYHLQ